MAKIQVIRQGESLVFSFDLDTTDPNNYVCTITVRQHPSDTATISRIVPISNIDGQNVAWNGFLTSAETSGLSVGLWILNASLVNSSTDEQTDIPVRFHVTENWTS